MRLIFEHRATSLLDLLGAFNLIKPELQNHFIEARFYRLIASQFQLSTTMITQEQADYGIKRARAMFDFRLKQIPAEERVQYKQLLKKACQVDADIQRYDNEGEYESGIAQKLCDQLGNFPLIIKNALQVRLGQAHAKNQCTIAVFIREYIANKAFDKAKSLLLLIEDQTTRQELSTEITAGEAIK
jgi:hypothetical protein